ncbi:hypothetical protein FOZ63_027919, partial [Perkinsus olseni]
IMVFDRLEEMVDTPTLLLDLVPGPRKSVLVRVGLCVIVEFMLPPSCVPVGVYPSADGSNMTQPVSLLHEWWPRFFEDTEALYGDKLLQGTCKAGECMFVPRGWWHCVINNDKDDDITIAITQNYCAESSVHKARRFFRETPHCISGLHTHDCHEYEKLQDEMADEFDKRLREKRPDLLARDEFTMKEVMQLFISKHMPGEATWVTLETLTEFGTGHKQQKGILNRNYLGPHAARIAQYNTLVDAIHLSTNANDFFLPTHRYTAQGEGQRDLLSRELARCLRGSAGNRLSYEKIQRRKQLRSPGELLGQARRGPLRYRPESLPSSFKREPRFVRTTWSPGPGLGSQSVARVRR